MNPDALADASRALWLATLSLMTAFMHTVAPAQRYLLAKRIARNFRTLVEQPCFTARDRDRFAQLAERWEVKADRLSPHEVAPTSGWRLLERLFPH